ncbi:MAG: ankyrin repeat domain-containing protein [Chitinophagaceae bacterium]|nr:ankyrin repeat domain-containing protein [Chitinophagaceae bacterium]
MKKQIKNSHRAFIAITFLSMLSIMASCQQRKEPNKNATVSETRVKPPKMDIHTAVMTGNMEALKQHIAAKSNLNEKDPFGGSSPLISASLFGKTAMAKLLIEAGADLNFRNNDGSTALHTASFFCRPEIVKMLLDKHADKAIKNKYGQNAYETVSGPFAAVKASYDGLGKMLEPMGLKLDYAYLEKTRPEIAAMLK